MVHRYLEGKARIPEDKSPWEDFIRSDNGWQESEHKDLYRQVEESRGSGLSFIQAAFECFTDRPLRIPQFQDALNDMWRVIKHGHKYLDTEAPWNKPKEEQERILGHVLLLLEAASWPLLAFMPEKAAKLRWALGLDEKDSRGNGSWARAKLTEAFVLRKIDPLFPRLETKKKD